MNYDIVTCVGAASIVFVGGVTLVSGIEGMKKADFTVMREEQKRYLGQDEKVGQALKEVLVLSSGAQEGNAAVVNYVKGREDLTPAQKAAVIGVYFTTPQDKLGETVREIIAGGNVRQ